MSDELQIKFWNEEELTIALENAPEEIKAPGKLEDYINAVIDDATNDPTTERLDHEFTSISQGGMMVFLHNKNKLPSNIFLLNHLGQEIDYNMDQLLPGGLTGEVTKDAIAIPLSDFTITGTWKLILLF